MGQISTANAVAATLRPAGTPQTTLNRAEAKNRSNMNPVRAAFRPVTDPSAVADSGVD